MSKPGDLVVELEKAEMLHQIGGLLFGSSAPACVPPVQTLPTRDCSEQPGNEMPLIWFERD
jgi:hypothetical protein